MKREDREIDHGFAWCIMGIGIIGFILVYGFSWTSGVFLDLFKEVFGESTAAIAMISSLNTASVYGVGPVAGVLTNRFSPRMVALCGAVLSCLGLLLSVFARNIYHLYASFGVMTGIGFGLWNIAYISLLALYFDKYRTIATGVAVSGVGLGTVIFPPLTNRLLTKYGWRGTILITVGLMMNLVVGAAALRVPQKYKYLYEKPSGNNNTSEPREGLHVVPNNNSIWNIHVFKNIDYVLLCVNNFFVIFGMSIVYVHISAYSQTKGCSPEEGAWLLSAIGLSTFVGRIAFGLLGRLSCVRSQTVYTTAFLLTGLVVLLLPLAHTFPQLLVAVLGFGLLSSCIGTLLPQIIAEFLCVTLVASGYGNLLVFEALGNFSGPPTAGWLYDWSLHYSSSFILGGGAVTISAAIMVAPTIRHRRRAHAQQEINLMDVKPQNAHTQQEINHGKPQHVDAFHDDC